MVRRPLGVDLDGVVTNLVSHVLDLFKSPLNPEDFGPSAQNNFHGMLGVSFAEFWARIDGTPMFWETIPTYPWVDDLFAVLNDHNFYPVFVTSPMNSPLAAAGKLRWILNRFGPDFRNWVLCRDKTLARIDSHILIDDQDDNIQVWEAASGHGILFPALTNRNRYALADPVSYVDSRLHALEPLL